MQDYSRIVMTETRSFQYALLISLLLHSILFARFPNVPFLPSRRVLEKIEVTYFKIQEPQRSQQVTRRSQTIAKKLPEIKKEEILESKAQDKSKAKLEKLNEKKETSIESKPKESGEVSEEIKKKPIYISYYRAIRERIKDCADRKFLKARNFPEGEVYLSFVVASNGELLELRVIDERSAENLFLKKAASESVREASPFPPFPEELNQSQINFNVIISFELR